MQPVAWANSTAQDPPGPGSRGLFARLGPFGLCVLIALLVVGAAVEGQLPKFVLAVVAVAAAVWIAQRPQRGVLLLVALVPFDGIRTPLGIDGTIASWKEALALFTAACALLFGKRIADRARPDWFWWLIALVVTALVWLGIHESTAAIWGVKLDFIYLTVAFAAWRCPLTAKDRDRFVSILMGVGVITAAYGIAQQAIGHKRLNEWGYAYNTVLRFNGGFLRSVSTFTLPFSFGFFLMMVIVICLPVALADLKRRRNQLFVVAMPLLVVGLLTSIVRAAALGLVAGLLYIGIRRFRSVFAVLVPLVLAAFFFIPGSSAMKALSSDSTKARSANWTQNLNAIVDHPLGMGVGETGAAKARSYGQTTEEQAAALGIDLSQADSDVYTPVLGTRGVYQPDNYYIKTVIELGLLGLWFLIRLLVGAFRESRRLERSLSPTDAALGIGITAYLTATVFSMFFSTYLELFPMDFYFWLLLGMTAATARDTPIGASVKRAVSRDVGSAVAVGAAR